MLILSGKLDLDLLELPRRYKQIRICPEMLLSFFKSDGYIFKVISDLPKDSRLVSINFNDMRFEFMMTLYSESFDIIPDGAIIPIETSIIKFQSIEL